jgi:hypothetical protein
MPKRSYKEAVEISVNWWVEKSFATKFNQNNGDNSDNNRIGFLLMNMAAANKQKEVTDDKIEKFKSKLTELLLANEEKGRYEKELDVDYNPNRILSEACKFAGINSICLPCKTFTFINNENEVEGRYQYGGELFKL